MYDAIKITDLPYNKGRINMESFNITTVPKPMEEEDFISISDHSQLYQEAVFANGKKTLKPMEDQIAVVKEILMNAIEADKKSDSTSQSKFDPKAFWKHQEIKKLENVMKDIFGFRSVQILPYIEKYISKTDDFESTEINCLTGVWDRFPIDGLVTDKGFYDSTHSITLDTRISLGLIKMMSPSELTAILLHEIGHNIDPAVVSISYAKTNIISKYLTDRKSELSKGEKKLLIQNKDKKGFISSTIAGMLVAASVVATFIAAIGMMVSSVCKSLFKKNRNKDTDIKTKGKINDIMLSKLKEAIKEDAANTEFNRKEFKEAFADNFPRMYGYGPSLSTAFVKMGKSNKNIIDSRIKREQDRQRCIMSIVAAGLKNEHKTDVHRIKALIKSYYEDINDPNTSDLVKKQLEEDVKEVEKCLDVYLNSFDEFQNRINKMISDEIDANEIIREQSSSDDQSVVSESTDILFGESKKAYEELMAREKTITSAERSEAYKTFGYSKKCSFAKDKDGYYCYTHRARSKSYPSITDIPKKDVEFVRSMC